MSYDAPPQRRSVRDEVREGRRRWTLWPALVGSQLGFVSMVLGALSGPTDRRTSWLVFAWAAEVVIVLSATVYAVRARRAGRPSR